MLEGPRVVRSAAAAGGHVSTLRDESLLGVNRRRDHGVVRVGALREMRHLYCRIVEP